MQFINKNTKRKISSILQGKKKTSPVPHLVETNDIPSDSEIILVQDALLRAREELEVLEYQLGRTTTTHQDALQKDKKNHRKFIRTHTAILSLIRRIPDDILATIFEEVAFSPRAYYSHPPWSLSQVCRNWRAIALSLPHVWKCIDLKLDVEKQKTHSFLVYLTNHLDRSKQVPLDIFVSCSSSAYDYVHHPYIDILCRYAERWGSVSASVPGTTLQAFAGVKGHLKVLHSASITLMSPGPYPDGTPLDMFEGAPELRRFSIGGYCPSLRLQLPWSQLLSYEDVLCSHTGVANALTSPQLHRLSLYPKRPFDDPEPLPTTTVDSLRCLSVSFSIARTQQDNIPTEYFDGLTLPALEELRFVNYGPPKANVLTALIQRSRCTHLTSLEFSPLTSFKPGELSAVLRLVPLLTDLVTLLPDINDIEDLALRGSSTDIVPSLQKLIFHAPFLLRRDYGRELAALAISRCETATPMYLRIVVYTLIYWHEGHEHLEAAFAPRLVAHTATTLNEEKTSALTELKHCIETLHVLLRTPIKGGPLTRAFAIGSLTIMKEFERCVEELMVTLEKIQFDDHREFYEAGLHHLLYHIVQVIEREAKILGQQSKFPHWKEQAEQLLDRWNQSYVFPFIEQRRWAFQGLHSFVYVPLNHDSRQVAFGVLRMVYGKTFFVDKYYTHPQHAVLLQLPSQLTYHD